MSSEAAPPPAPSTGVVLALDFGGRRIGVAVTDMSRRFLFGRDTIQRGAPPVGAPRGTAAAASAADLAGIRAAAQADGATLVVVGLPLNVDGSEGAAARGARAFAATVGESLGLPVLLVDERYSSIEADDLLREQHADPRARRARVDMAAAIMILRTFLDHGPVVPPGASPDADSRLPL